MQMFYTNKDNQIIEYTLKTTPPEAMYWTTHNLKKSEIKLITKMPRAEAALTRQEILDAINESDNKKYGINWGKQESVYKIQKKRKTPNTNNVKTGQKQRKTGRKNTKT